MLSIYIYLINHAKQIGHILPLLLIAGTEAEQGEMREAYQCLITVLQVAPCQMSMGLKMSHRLNITSFKLNLNCFPKAKKRFKSKARKASM